MHAELPPEILYEIVAIAFTCFIDKYLDRAEKHVLQEDSTMYHLLRTSRQIRDVTRKVLKDALGVEARDCGRYSVCAHSMNIRSRLTRFVVPTVQPPLGISSQTSPDDVGGGPCRHTTIHLAEVPA